jgi:hypothetical protein
MPAKENKHIMDENTKKEIMCPLLYMMHTDDDIFKSRQGITSSPLTQYSSSSSSPTRSNHVSSEHDEEDQFEDKTSSDPAYLPDVDVPSTSTGTPLHNKPRGYKTMSSASIRRLQSHGHLLDTCILTRETRQMGAPIEKSHMIPQATGRRRVRIDVLMRATN